MILPDVSVLIYAFRPESAAHAEFRDWLDSVVNGEMAYGISPQVMSSFIRIVTHPRIYAHPSSLEQAARFSSLLLGQSHCQILQPGARHWGIFLDLCAKSRATGNLVQDAWFAALAIEHGCEWITEDRDYARFAGLRWRSLR